MRQASTSSVHDGDGGTLSGATECMYRGKKFTKFEQQWFEHIHEYMAKKDEQADMWRTVVCRS